MRGKQANALHQPLVNANKQKLVEFFNQLIISNINYNNVQLHKGVGTSFSSASRNK